jgi:hypothetical protein
MTQMYELFAFLVMMIDETKKDWKSYKKDMEDREPQIRATKSQWNESTIEGIFSE